MTEEELQDMIDQADRDGDGEINPDEFYRIMKKRGDNPLDDLLDDDDDEPAPAKTPAKGKSTPSDARRAGRMCITRAALPCLRAAQPCYDNIYSDDAPSSVIAFISRIPRGAGTCRGRETANGDAL